MSDTKPGAILHVVMGQSGSYSDVATWAVAAYLDLEKAERHADLANAWVKDTATKLRELADTSAVTHTEYMELADMKNPYDASHAGRDCGSYYAPDYIVDMVFLHHDPANFQQETEVLTDLARENGWLP